MNILMTSGATREPIDSVRFISNFSTGKTGAALCEAFSLRGAAVTFLSGEGSAVPSTARHVIRFGSFSDLNSSMERVLREEKFDAIVHMAAVSDYSITEVHVDGKPIEGWARSKLTSTAQILELKLRPNFKIIERIASYSCNPNISIVAFKLTDTEIISEQKMAVAQIFSTSEPHFVIHNDMHLIREGKREFKVYSADQEFMDAHSVADLAQILYSEWTREKI